MNQAARAAAGVLEGWTFWTAWCAFCCVGICRPLFDGRGPGNDGDCTGCSGCGVPTGWGSAVYAAEVEPGDTVVIYGIGGIGANAVQGAAMAGAANVVAVDPLANKREAAEDLGATHSVASAEEAYELSQELTRGVGADKSIVTVDVVDEAVVGAAFEVIRKEIGRASCRERV